MSKIVIVVVLFVMMAKSVIAADRDIVMTVEPENPVVSENVQFQCIAEGDWNIPLIAAKVILYNPDGERVLRQNMDINGLVATFNYTFSADEMKGDWKYRCRFKDGKNRKRAKATFTLAEDRPGETGDHGQIQSYEGPSTCIACHEDVAREMLASLHMTWSGQTPQLINTNGEEKGKNIGGINTFCTYAKSSKGACYSCHVRKDGNADHPPELGDIDCLMCHNDTYQRKFVGDPDSTETVTNILGETKTYVFGKVDNEGNYITETDFVKMPEGTTMLQLARNVHKPTRKSCLRCHAKAGGGDWTKRGDLGLSSENPSRAEDVHMSPDGADLTCAACHSFSAHKVGGRGIDLRQTEAPVPSCQECHTVTPHSNQTLNRHAQGQVSCQVCHIRKFGKGGATEMERDWRIPVWNQAFCSGQGGFVGEEIKESNVKPEYVWFDGKSTVYNVGETIEIDERGVFPMAKANGWPFDGNSKIVPIKRHYTIMPLHESGKIIPPAIMWMFMTGDFDVAVQKGMEEQGMTGGYSLVSADAEMLITHGVEPKENAPSCGECHDFSGKTADDAGMLPLETLGYHILPEAVKNCTLCHEKESLSWQEVHVKHGEEGEEHKLSCTNCHSSEPTGFVQPKSSLCASCHKLKSWKDEGHKKHLKKGYECAACHSFS